MILYYFDTILLVLFVIGLVFWVGYYTFFRQRAFFIYTASVLVCGSLLSFITIYPYHARYNRTLWMAVIMIWLALAGTFVYQITTAKCLCGFKQMCQDGKCVSTSIPDTTSSPTPTSRPGGCPECGSKKIECCNGTCTSFVVDVDGERVVDDFCCDPNKIIYESGQVKCCGGGQIAVIDKDRQYCTMPCGSMKCNQGEICSVVEKPKDESSSDFSKRIDQLKKSIDYSNMEVQNDRVLFCQIPGDTDCKMQINRTFPSIPEAFYLYDGDCTNPDYCDLSGYRMYYSGKYIGPSSGFTQYLKSDIIGTCKNPELFCFQEGSRQAGITYQQYNPVNSECIYEKSGNLIPSFMSRPLSTDGKCDPDFFPSDNTLCMDTGEILFYDKTYYIYPNLEYDPLIARIDDFQSFVNLKQTDAYDFQIVPSISPHTFPAWVDTKSLKAMTLDFIKIYNNILFTQNGWLRSNDGAFEVKESIVRNNNIVLLSWWHLGMVVADLYNKNHGHPIPVYSVCDNKNNGCDEHDGCLSSVQPPIFSSPFHGNFQVVKLGNQTNDYRDVLMAQDENEPSMCIIIPNGSSEQDRGYLWSHGQGWCADLKGRWNVFVSIFDKNITSLYDLVNPSRYIRRGDFLILSSYCSNCNETYYMTDGVSGSMMSSLYAKDAAPVAFQQQNMV